jgi:glycosyltransferase involved in cell wall biosynthesis
MHVALNLVYLVPGETGGMETYARELIPHLAEHVRLTALVNRESAAEEFGCEQVVVPVNARNRLQWVRGEQQHVPGCAKRAGADLLHSLGSTSPLWGSVPRVTTIHDLNYAIVPEAHEGLRGLGMRLLVPAAARRSRRIITLAESTVADLERILRVPPAKVDVIPHGVHARTAPEVTPEPELRERLQLGGGPFLLSVSGKKPSKNLMRLLDALAQIPAERRPRLVVPGYPTPHEADLREHAERLGVGVAWPPWVSAADLEGLYAAAEGFVFPSLYEGFGFPVAEAMVRGVPVATSDRGSLAEVAGDAALLFDPEDVDAIRAAIERLPDEAERLRAAGRAQAARFTWERSAELHAASYERALSG